MLTSIFIQILAGPRTGESNLINVDIKVEFQGEYAEDYVFYG